MLYSTEGAVKESVSRRGDAVLMVANKVQFSSCVTIAGGERVSAIVEVIPLKTTYGMASVVVVMIEGFDTPPIYENSGTQDLEVVVHESVELESIVTFSDAPASLGVGNPYTAGKSSDASHSAP